VPSQRTLEGVFVPLVTPFDVAGRIDVASLERLAAESLDAGAAGIVALGTTGEASALDDAERSEVVTACARVCGDKGAQLIVGAGTYDTRTTIARHEQLAEVPGVIASLAVVPYYVRPSEAGIVAHFTAVAERSPVPLVLYNVPYRTGRGLGAAALLELAARPNVAGVKRAVGAIDAETLRLLAGAPPSCAVLGGDAPYLLPIVLMGGAGAIAATAHVRTSDFVRMIDDGLAGRVADARARAEALLPVALALFAEPNPAVIKGVLHAQGRMPTPDVRLPLTKRIEVRGRGCARRDHRGGAGSRPLVADGPPRWSEQRGTPRRFRCEQAGWNAAGVDEPAGTVLSLPEAEEFAQRVLAKIDADDAVVRSAARVAGIDRHDADRARVASDLEGLRRAQRHPGRGLEEADLEWLRATFTEGLLRIGAVYGVRS
jgi:4-hydroxy-tetrahydrodipicolinate synthase